MVQTDEVVTQPKSKRGRWILGGCGVLVLSALLAVYGTREWVGHSFTSPYLAEVSVPNAEYRVYAYASGFRDVLADFVVEHDGRLHILSSSVGEHYESITFHVATDGQVVATRSNLAHCRGGSSSPDALDDDALTVYTDAFDFTTGTLIHTTHPCQESETARQARHDEISALLEAHGGVGSTYTPTWSPGTDPAMRRMGYWEWKRWERRLKRVRAETL